MKLLDNKDIITSGITQKWLQKKLEELLNFCNTSTYSWDIEVYNIDNSNKNLIITFNSDYDTFYTIYLEDINNQQKEELQEQIISQYTNIDWEELFDIFYEPKNNCKPYTHKNYINPWGLIEALNYLQETIEKFCELLSK